MKRVVLLCLTMAVLMVVAGAPAADQLAADQAEKKADQEAKAVCPISGKEISKDASIDYKGGKLYFCCGGCPASFQKDSAKYEAKANKQLVVTGQAKQVACPFSGDKVDESTKMKVDGVEVAFCCTGCQGKVKKAEPDQQREMVFGKGFDKGFEVKK